MATNESDTARQPASPRRATEVDVRLGQLIRERRIAVGLSQSELADAIQITQHQLLKYERGENRIAASRLVTCAKVLGVPPSWFFSWTLTTKSADVSDPEAQLLELYRSLTPVAQKQLLSIATLLRRDAATDG